MGIDKEQESRLMGRGTPADDPTWGEVSAFLEAVESAYADIPTAQYEASIVAAVSHEARSIRNQPQTNRRTSMKDLFTFKTHRLLVGSVIAAVIALTAGVGVAAATGAGPLAQLLPAAPETSAPSVDPTASSTPTEEPTATASEEPTPTASDGNDDADDQSEAADESGDDSTSQPSATPTSHRENDDAEEADDSSDDSSDHEKASSSAEPSDDDEADDQSDDSSDDSSDHEKAGSSQDQSGDNSADDSGDNSGDDGSQD